MPRFEEPPRAHKEMHQAEQERVPLSAIELPDLSPLDPEGFIRTEVIETELEIGGVTFPCQITFERYKEPDVKQILTGPFQKAQVHLEVLDPDIKKRVAVFKGALQFGHEGSNPVVQDGKDHAFWRIFTRRVEKTSRHRGMGSTILQAFEQLTKRIGEAYPDLQAEWITISTYLSSLTRLIISQEWLAEHHLRSFQKSSGSDFGYIPHANDIGNIPRVLEAESEELQDVSDSHLPEVRLFKKL